MDIFAVRQAIGSGTALEDLPLKVTFYARVSTDKDAQLHSLSSQVEYYTDLIRSNPMWTYVEGYTDEGISGTSARKRESFLRMITDARTGKFDLVITKEISRFSRSTLDSILYTQELLKYGVGVLFQSDQINTLAPDAELRLTILSSIAQEEVRKTSERVKFGFRRAIERGVVLGNNKIWGYDKQEGRLTVNEPEAKLVRLIFDLYANRRWGIRKIAAYLSEMGMKNRNERDFSFSTIRGILSNPKYKGFYCGGKTQKYDYKLSNRKKIPQEEWVLYRDEDGVPAIVSEGIWEKANELLNQRSKKQRSENPGGYQNKYPYSGKIFCAKHQTPCYHGIYRYRGKSRELWRCKCYVEKGKIACNAKSLYANELDDLTRILLEKTGFCEEEAGRRLLECCEQAASAEKKEESLENYQSKIEALVRRKDRLLDLSVEGRISNEEFERQNQRFNEMISLLEQRIYDALAASRAPKAKQFDPSCAAEVIRRALNFPEGIPVGVAEALIERVMVSPQEGNGEIPVHITLKDGSRFSARLLREKGKPSVWSVQYI